MYLMLMFYMNTTKPRNKIYYQSMLSTFKGMLIITIGIKDVPIFKIDI